MARPYFDKLDMPSDDHTNCSHLRAKLITEDGMHYVLIHARLAAGSYMELPDLQYRKGIDNEHELQALALTSHVSFRPFRLTSNSGDQRMHLVIRASLEEAISLNGSMAVLAIKDLRASLRDIILEVFGLNQMHEIPISQTVCTHADVDDVYGIVQTLAKRFSIEHKLEQVRISREEFFADQ